MVVMTWTSWTGCATRVISAGDREVFIKAGQPFTPEQDGVFMTETRYQRYRQAVADEILKAKTKQ